ncbi:ABC transporter permease [Thalassospira sp.]|uniref:ABC transporter permease n=1 Tax=Thalassospira sp. TaxID=1912094 RepID=UPI0027332BDB|nr:ABC transporter permease [Thalassospira sp.]MDP2699778.1 ABC transporter permease [Thalassospira sp.]
MNRLASAKPWLLSGPALLLFLVFLLIPLVMTFLLSFNSFSFYGGIEESYGLGNYIEILSDSYFYEIFLRTFLIALGTTILCVLLGVPEAYILLRMRPFARSLMLLVVLGPLLISVVVRTLGWSILLGNKGVINEFLIRLDLISSPVKMLYTSGGIVVALVHVMIPFMIIAVWAALQRRDASAEQAAESLGASPVKVFTRIVLPQAMPGILSGSLIVFSLSASAFATPAILGGRRIKVISTTVYDEFLNTLNWPLGAAIAVLLLVSVLVIMLSWNRLVEKRYSGVFE